MAVLVAGVGYIGAQLVSDLLASGEEVVGVDNLFSTDPAVIERFAANPRFHFIRGNVADPRVLASAFRLRPVSAVYFLAAQASAHPEAAKPRYTEATNLLAPRVLLEAMRRNRVRTIAYASSFRVYGDQASLSTAEDSPYGAFRDLSHLSKVYVEKLLEMYAALFGMRCLVARIGIVHGLSPVMKRDCRFLTVPNKFCLQRVCGEMPSVYPGNERESALAHVADAAAAMRFIVGHTAFDGYVPINVVTEWISVANLAKTVAALPLDVPDAGPRIAPASLVICAVPPKLAPHSRLAAAGFQPTRTLADSLPEVLAHFRTIGLRAAGSNARGTI